MKKIYSIIGIALLGVVAFLISCERDNEAMLTTLSVTNEDYKMSYTSAIITCHISSEATLGNVYLHYSTRQDFEEYDAVEMQARRGMYHTQLTDLQDNTIYYIRYAASNRFSSIIGDDVYQIQTLKPSVPSIIFDTITTIWDTYANILFHLEFDGGAPLSEMGICWNKESVPTIESNTLSTKDTFATLKISDLQPNTMYYVRAYATNKVGVAYSEEHKFLTYDNPKVETRDVTEINLTSALLSGELKFNGNDKSTTVGFCWSESSQPTLSNNHKEVSYTSNIFKHQVSNLKDETKYYVRAYAQNKIGIVYGEEKSFTTNATSLPTITTSTITQITETSAVAGGNITNDGGAEIQERGVVYSTTEYPTTSNNKVQSGNGTGSFTCNLTNLSDETTYYVRAYAINKKGTAYGEQVSFKTKACTKPTVITENIIQITNKSAAVTGNVIKDGGCTITERGIVYANTQNPTISNNKIISGTGTGAFTCELTGLLDGTKYYVRAYAINTKGVAYGENMSFVTKTYSLPAVTTSAPTNITSSSATISGNVTNNGGTDIIEQGICYATIQTPTINNYKVIYNSTGIGSFTCTLTGLVEGTTYYARAYARNSVGVAYGEVVNFVALETKNITAKALVPDHWDETITAWVWHSNESGKRVYPTREGEWYVVTEKCTELNLVFCNGTDWNGNHNQTVDIVSLRENACLRIAQSGTSKATYTLIDCKTDPNFVFSVSANEKVIFSNGNLQYQASSNTFRFAENQWDCMDAYNCYRSDSYSGWIDLFYHDQIDSKFSISNNDKWRNLTYEEWYYLLNTRLNASNLQGAATINGIHGYILLPDNWITPNGLNFVAASNIRDINQYSVNDWYKMESHGAIFLPCAGEQYAVIELTRVNECGSYWHQGSSYTYFNSLGYISLLNEDEDKQICYSVRLVQNVK